MAYQYPRPAGDGLAQQLRVSAATGTYRATMPRLMAGDNTAAATSGVAVSAPIFLRAGDVVSALTWVSGATALVTGTVQRGALYSAAPIPALLSKSADDVAGVWAANTAKTFTLAAAQTIAVDGFYWACLVIAAATVPSLAGRTVQAGAAGPVITGDLNLAVTHGSALTDAPATIATPAVRAGVPLVIAR